MVIIVKPARSTPRYLFRLNSDNISPVASQNFEYKISNILDKPTESMFGYISVLVSSLLYCERHEVHSHESPVPFLHTGLWNEICFHAVCEE